MFLIDTDVSIWVLRGNLKVTNFVSRLKQKGSVCLSVITVAEIYMNVFPSEMKKVEDFVDQNIIHLVTQEIAKIAGMFWKEYVPRLKNLSITDCLIAATAIEHEVELVTLNKKHFPMKELKLTETPKLA